VLPPHDQSPFRVPDDAWYHWAAIAVPFSNFRATRPFLAVLDGLLAEKHREIVRAEAECELVCLEQYRQEITEIFVNWEYQDALSKALDLEELFEEIAVTCMDCLPDSDRRIEARSLAFAYLNPPNIASVLLYFDEFLMRIDEIWTPKRFPMLNPWLSQRLEFLHSLLELEDRAGV
jgi:hypothetical protein